MDKRIELRAMKFAEDYYEKLGWKVVNSPGCAAITLDMICF